MADKAITPEQMKADLMQELQKLLAASGLTPNSIRNLKALALQKMDKQHHIRLWRPVKIDVRDVTGKKVGEDKVWIQTGWLVKEQTEKYFKKGFAVEPPKDAVFPYNYKMTITNLETMEKSYVRASEYYKGTTEAPEHKGHVYMPDGKMTIQEAKDTLTKKAFAEWSKEYLGIDLAKVEEPRGK